jgi:hypothetical protein
MEAAIFSETLIAKATLRHSPQNKYLGQWYSFFLFAYPHMLFLFDYVPPKLLKYNSSYTLSIIYL